MLQLVPELVVFFVLLLGVERRPHRRQRLLLLLLGLGVVLVHGDRRRRF